MTKHKFAAAAVLTAFLAACSSKPEPNAINVGLTLTNRAVNYELQGDVSMAAYTYNRALAKFRDMGRFCDMSRVSLLMYTVKPGEENESRLEDAAAFAALGSCAEEANIINFLKDKDYDYSSLQEPYKSMAKFRRNKDTGPLKSLASSGSTSDAIRSSVYRIIAGYLLEKEPEEAIKYAEEAKKTDGRNAWTKNILADEEIILEASGRIGLDTDTIAERINILKQALEEKGR